MHHGCVNNYTYGVHVHVCVPDVRYVETAPPVRRRLQRRPTSCARLSHAMASLLLFGGTIVRHFCAPRGTPLRAAYHSLNDILHPSKTNELKECFHRTLTRHIAAHLQTSRPFLEITAVSLSQSLHCNQSDLSGELAHYTYCLL